MTASRSPRVAVLWTHATGYLHVELQALVGQGADVWLFRQEEAADAPFASESVTQGLRSSSWAGAPDVGEIVEALDDFEPDAVLVASWHVGSYRKVARTLRGKTLRVLAMDNQWWGTWKQWGGVALSRFVIRPAYDAVFLPADPQAAFARRLGFADEQIIGGLNSCDYQRFASVAERRGGRLPPKRFLFVGRLVPAKAVDVLADSYERYRQSVDDPWPLLVAGTGPETHWLEDRDGIELLGFVQPADVPAVFERSACLVVPSRFEPWSLAIHEAGSAGLPVICTRVCGASSRLVLDGYNGAVIAPEDPAALANALVRIHNLDDEERREMGTASAMLARQYTPDRWAKTLLTRLPELRSRTGLVPAPWAGSGAAPASTPS